MKKTPADTTKDTFHARLSFLAQLQDEAMYWVKQNNSEMVRAIAELYKAFQLK